MVQALGLGPRKREFDPRSSDHFFMQNKVELTGTYGSDELHALSAWTSTSRDLTPEKRERIPALLKQLAEAGHHSPFEKSMLHFLVVCDTASHIHLIKHRIGVCIAGDSEVWTETIAKSGRTIRKRAISTLYENWHLGVLDKAHTRYGRRGVEEENITERRRLLPSCRNQSIRVLNEETNLFELGNIEDVIYSGKKELLKLETSDNVLFCTPEHAIFTDKGWVKAGDLLRLDMIATSGIRGVGEPRVPRRLRQGIGIWTQKQRNNLIKPIDFCYSCNKEFERENLELDHVVPVYIDLKKALDITNLSPMCSECHLAKTKLEQVRETRTAAGAKFLPLLTVPRISKEEDTYDLTVRGNFNNFVANGIVVHNSVNAESARYKELKDDKFYIPEDWPELAKEQYTREIKKLYEIYHRAIEVLVTSGMNRKRAKESARFVLPYANQLTLDVSFNFRSFMHFQELRNNSHAQKEIRAIAQEMLQLVRDTHKFDATLKAFGY